VKTESESFSKNEKATKNKRMSTDTAPVPPVASVEGPKTIANSNNNNNSVSIEDSLESGFADGLASSSSGIVGSSSSIGGSSPLASPTLSSIDEQAASASGGPTEEERLAWEQEMRKVEEEMATLRLVLQAKFRRSTELKKKLGITQLDEFKADVNYALKVVQESSAYNKTAATLQVVSSKSNAAISSVVEAFKGAVNENVANPGPEKVSNTIFRDAHGKLASAANATGTYVAQTVESVKSKPTVQTLGASVNSTWSALKARVVGTSEAEAPQQQQQPDFIGEVVGKEPEAQ